MLLAPEYTGIDLPIFDTERPVATSTDLHRGVDGFVDPRTGTFLRGVEILLFNSERAPLNLDTLLTKTDEELEAIAWHCGSTVVSHTWGLCKVDACSSGYRPYANPSATHTNIKLPEGHILAAEVAFVPNATINLSRPQRRQVEAGIDEYHRSNIGKYQLWDTRPDQFVRERGTTSTVHLVDIEPRFGTTTERESYLN